MPANATFSARRSPHAAAIAEPLESRQLCSATVFNRMVETPAASVTIGTAISFGRIAGKSVTASAVDPITGVSVNFKVTGPGSGTVTPTADGLDVVVTGSKASSSLVVTSSATAQLHDVTIGGSIKRIEAGGINLAGNLAVSGGVAAMTFANAFGQHQISVGAGHIAGRFTFQNINQLSIDSLEPIGVLSAKQWIEDPASRGHVTAPYFGQVRIAGNFQADLTATNSLHGVSVGNFLVEGAIEGAQIRTILSVQKLIAAELIDSNVYAGVSAGVDTLPTSKSDFTRKANIGSLTVRGPVGTPVVSGSNIAATRIGKIALGPIQSLNQGAAFGVAAEHVGSYMRGPTGVASGKTVVRKNLITPGVVDSKDDYTLTIL